MKIRQFEDKGLSHFSYAVHSEISNEIVLIDPARNPQPYYDFANARNARITGVIQTHPHADFVSSHMEIHLKTGAAIFVSKWVGADYPHRAFDEGDVIELGEVKLKAIFTPGHSPDGISIIAEENGKDNAVFTGDTLFIGDVGRPDLREQAGSITSQRKELARLMYKSTREKLMKLDNDVLVYPAHGSGSLCGKSLSDAHSSTIGAEKISNYALQPMSEAEFIDLLVQDQPFIPKYFSHDVGLNKKGAPAYRESLHKVKLNEKNYLPKPGSLIVDGRPQDQFIESHIKGAINIQDGLKFETWLGSIVGQDETFYLTAASEEALWALLEKAAKIGYELLVSAAFVYDATDGVKSKNFDKKAFEKNQDAFTIIDIRNRSETKAGMLFSNVLNLPLPELRERAHEIPTDKPIVVHCAGGYRSAAGSSILRERLPVEVFDMSDAVKDYM